MENKVPTGLKCLAAQAFATFSLNRERNPANNGYGSGGVVPKFVLPLLLNFALTLSLLLADDDKWALFPFRSSPLGEIR